MKLLDQKKLTISAPNQDTSKVVESDQNHLLQKEDNIHINLEKDERDIGQHYRRLNDIVLGWLPSGYNAFMHWYHTLLYGLLTCTLAIYALHIGNTQILMALWTAAATFIGVEKTEPLVQTVTGYLNQKRLKETRQEDSREPQLPTSEPPSA